MAYSDDIYRLDDSSDEGIIPRPYSFDEYTGQKKLVSNLKVFIQAAKNRGETLEHTLFYGPPGLGKTTLANIIAHELNANIKITSGPMLKKAGDLVAILTNLQMGDILFIDEIHRLDIRVEEILYPAMEDFKLDILIGQGPAARSMRIDLPRWTLVGATTKLGNLSSPLRDRFGITMQLEYYSDEELASIIKRSATRLNIEVESIAAKEIARRSRGTPRVANKIFLRVRDFAEVLNKGIISQEVTLDSLERLGIDSKGLDSGQRALLLSIIEKYDGGPVGLETLATAISEDKDTVEDSVEPYLIYKGFIQKTARGRVATKLAYDHFKLPYTKAPLSIDSFIPNDD